MTDPVDPNASLQYDGLGQDPDRTYLRLKGCREKLCLVQMDVPRHWSDEVGQAINLIDMVGSAVCPDQWSKDNQPEYPKGDSCDHASVL